jgi:hypothetical protein
MGELIRLGKHAGLREQLDVIEAKADKLREKAARDRFALTLPGWTERDDIWAD